MLRCFREMPMFAAMVLAHLALVLLSTPGFAAAGQMTPTPAAAVAFTSKAKQAILMDADSGAVLYQHEADKLVPPASMSKLMTLAVVFRALKAGTLKPSDPITMSVNAWRTGGAPSGTSAMFVPVNETATVEEMLQGIAIQSGNDACIALAESMAGSEASFAEMMTAEARRIGLSRSTFRNSTGLFHPEHLMSMRELGQLARHIMLEYPDQFALFGQKEFKYRKHRFINRNPLLFMDIGVTGMKTGFISEAGYGMVATATQEGRRLIAVLGGLDNANERRDETKRLLEWGFKSFGEFKLYDPGEVVGEARVWGGDRFYVPLTGKSGVAIVLPRYPANQRLAAEIIYKGPLKAPIRKGDEVARLRVTSSSTATNEVPLYAAEDVAPAGVMRRGFDSLVHLALGWVKM